VLAVRLAAGATGGPLGALFKVGGVSSGPLGLAFGQVLGVTGTFPVRGYRYGELLGQRAATATVEYRVPLALLGHSLGHLPVGADKAWLNLFADAGDAWNPGAQPVFTRLRSTGLELANDINVSYDISLTVRVGVAEQLAPPPSGNARRPRVYAGLASDF
jgi:hemolysin activation/secretion protein